MRALMAQAIKSSGLSRDQVADRMASILNEPITVHSLNAWLAEIIFQRRLQLLLGDAERFGLIIRAACRQFFPCTVRGLPRLDRKAGEGQGRHHLGRGP